MSNRSILTMASALAIAGTLLAGCADQILPAEGTIPVPTGQDILYAARSTTDASPTTSVVGMTNIDGSATTIFGSGMIVGRPRGRDFLKMGLDQSLVLRTLGRTDSTLLYTKLNGEALNLLSAAFTPDGSQIVFGAHLTGQTSTNDLYRGNLYIVNRDGSNLRRIADNLSHDGQIAITPDGREVVYYGDPAGLEKSAICVVAIDGGTPRRIAGNANPSFDGSSWLELSKDGQKVLFIGLNDREKTDVFTVKIDGTELTNLTNDDATDACATYSPDGLRIAWIGGELAEVHTMSATGGKKTSVSSGVDQGLHFHPRWSADGRRILYTLFPPFPATTRAVGTMKVLDISTRQATSVGPADYGYWVE